MPDISPDRDREERFARLADPLPIHAVEGRIDSKVVTKDSRHSARFVLYTEAWYLAQRLDHFFPGDWSLDVTPLPTVTEENETLFALKASLTVGGITREDVGQGRDWKQASTDAFKRAARRFGIGAELMLADPLYVEVDSDSKFARPMESPAKAYLRRYKSLPRIPAYVHADPATPPAEASRPVAPLATSADPNDPYGSAPVTATAPAAAPASETACPKCGGRMWDNRLTKTNPKQPDFKCRDRECAGVIWPPKEDKLEASARANGVPVGSR